MARSPCLAVTLALLGLSTVSACAPSEHQLFVDVRTDLVAGADFDRVSVQVFDERGAFGTLLRTAEDRVVMGDSFFNGRRILEQDALADGSYVIRAELTLAGALVIDGSAPITLGSDRAVTVTLSRSCLTLRCPPAGSPDKTACVHGACAEPACLVDESHPDCPRPSTSDAGADGGSGVEDAGIDAAVDGGVDGGVAPPMGMVYVPAGPFRMGCNASLDTICEPDEYPLHEVTLSAFFLDRREVSQAEYAPCVSAGVCAIPMGGMTTVWDPAGTPNDPVVDMERMDAEAFCTWVGKRLPTEAEWEKAARGTDSRVYAWGNDPPRCGLANYLACGNRVEPVDTHPDVPSPYGTINQSGNVWEWVADYYAEGYYATSPTVDPRGPATGTTSVIRGGSFDWEDFALRTSRRLEWDHPTSVIGVRCALDAE